ncbi:hypothetical protein [Mycolicibacter algericus]|uniref:hypothetical protein n=1 Tax=Mycolicibacter algericus TaxID=1288388 RepID=UPI003C789E5E
MRRRFRSYALAADGGPLKVDSYYGYDDAEVQREFQRRTNQPANGIVSDGDLHYLGLLPTLFSIHGTGQADPFGIGYPADIGRRCLDLYWWQPVGNWPAIPFPMDESVGQGEAELVRLITDPVITPGPVAFVDYSQGSIIGGRIRNRMRNGDLSHLYPNLMGNASFGNPMRPTGSYAGVVDPTGHGIDPQLEIAVESGTCNLAAHGDLYTTCPDGDVGEFERAVFNAVFRRFFGLDTLTEQFWELLNDPAREIPAMVQAIINAGMFFLQGTAPHTRYHVDECPGTGLTYYEYAIKHLRDLATTRLERIIAEGVPT